jgi:hypothetical protein
MTEEALTVKALPGDLLPFVGWVKSHWTEMPGILDKILAVRNAPNTLSDKWDAIKTFGDSAVSVLADFPGMPGAPVMAAGDEAQMRATVQGIFDDEPMPVGERGELIKWIIANGPTVIAFFREFAPLIKEILDLFKKV